MTNLLRVAPALALVLVLPGLLAATAAGLGGGWFRRVVAAPLLSIGILMPVALLWSAVGVRVDWWSVLPVALLLPGALLLVARRTAAARPGRRARTERPQPPPVSRLAQALTVVVAVVAIALWVHASHFGGLVPPNDDGTHHGLFTARILRLGTLDPRRVAVGDVLTDDPSTGFYPFGLHLAAAMVARVSGVGVGTAVDGVLVLMAGLVLPAGMHLLTRRLFPAYPLAAPASALVAVSLPAFPYYVSYWGGLPLICGMALVPVFVDLALGVPEQGLLGGGLTTALGLVGLFEIHVTELVTAALVAGLVVAVGVPAREWGRHLGRWLVGGAGLLLVVVPQLPAFLADSRSRVDVAPLPALPRATAWSDVVGTFVGTGSVAAAVTSALVVCGLVAAALRRTTAGFVLSGLLLAGLTYASAVGTSLGHRLASPWYTRWDRVVLNEIFFVAVLAGVGAALVARALARVEPARARGVASAVVAGALLVLPLAPQWSQSRAQLRLAFGGASLVRSDQVRAFDFLRAHVKPGQRVLNDVTDGSTWMYADAGVAPVFAMAVHAYPPQDWGDRIYLQSHPGLGTDPRSIRAADQWDVQWAYVSRPLFPFRRPRLSLRSLEQSPSWRQVYSNGTVVVFERKPSSA